MFRKKILYFGRWRFIVDNSRVSFRLVREWSQPPKSICLGNKAGKKSRSIFGEDPLKEKEQIREILLELFSSQKLAVLGTHQAGQPYGSLVAFAATPDLKSLLFATTRATRKFANLQADSRVSMVFDNRSNRVADFRKAVAATALGRAKETKGKEREKWVKIYLAKHPHLKEFVSSPTCALVRIRVEVYYLVWRFQNVFEWRVKP
jgi:nitroimidazol reductase NimA-like FMN-containing flavoprotein (pyridoxamine 5'-phosphate oxidase superfamily)